MAYHISGLYWIGFAFLVDAEAYAWAMPFAITLMPAGLALFAALAVSAAHHFWMNGPVRAITLATFWLLAEWLRGTILTGFPWNLPGYTWIGFLPMAQSASILGIYGLSLFTVLLCAWPAALCDFATSKFAEGKSKLYGSIALVALLSFTSIWGAARLGPLEKNGVEGVTLRVIQANIPQKEKWKPENRADIFSLYLQMSAYSGPNSRAPKPTHIIWPESAVPIYLTNRDDALASIAEVLQPSQTLLTGAVRYESVSGPDGPDGGTGGASNRYFNSFHVISGDGEVLSTYDKFHLVPFGEYLPLTSVLSKIGLRKLTQGATGYSAGPGPRLVEVPGAGNALPLICYEAIFPGHMPEGARPAWLMNVTNDAWFGNSSGPRQHLAQSQMRTIEQGLPMVRSANTGISAVIDGHGRIWKRIGLNQQGILESPLPPALDITFYSRSRDLLFWLALAVFGGFLFWRRGRITNGSN
jgi:apolipoprotein N-acyltransferase